MFILQSHERKHMMQYQDDKGEKAKGTGGLSFLQQAPVI